MNIPSDLLYTKDHEWIKIENGIATVGITDYAQGELGDIIFIEFLYFFNSNINQLIYFFNIYHYFSILPNK